MSHRPRDSEFPLPFIIQKAHVPAPSVLVTLNSVFLLNFLAVFCKSQRPRDLRLCLPFIMQQAHFPTPSVLVTLILLVFDEILNCVLGITASS